MRTLISNSKKQSEDLSVALARLSDVLHCNILTDKEIRGSVDDVVFIEHLNELLSLDIYNDKPVYISTQCISELLAETSRMLSKYETLIDYADKLEQKQAKLTLKYKLQTLWNRLIKRQ